MPTLLADITKQHILETLRQCGGNRTWAAKELGLSLRGLRLKLKNYTGDDGQEISGIVDGSFEKFDLLPSQIAVLDYAGAILSTNAAWERTAAVGGLGEQSCRLNYFTECDAAAQRGCTDAAQIAHGLRSIARDEAATFRRVYECCFGGRFHWFQLEAVSSQARGSIVTHTNLNLLEHDAETELPNERLFLAQASYSRGEAATNGRAISLCLVTMTETARAASIFGPSVASDAVKEIARRLRLSAGNQQFLARTGPAEFAVLDANGTRGSLAPQMHFLRIILALRKPVIVGPHITGISARVEISSCPVIGG